RYQENNIFLTALGAKQAPPIAGATTAISPSIRWTIALSTTPTSTTRRRVALTGVHASATSGLPGAPRHEMVPRILSLRHVTEARRFLTHRYQSTAGLTAQRFPMAHTTRY